LGEIFVYGLPLDYFERLPASINAVTAADVERAAKKYIHPESAVVIGAGDRSKIEEQLKKLSLGAVEVRDYEGVPVIGQTSPGESH
jgi:zinc protease